MSLKARILDKRMFFFLFSAYRESSYPRFIKHTRIASGPLPQLSIAKTFFAHRLLCNEAADTQCALAAAIYSSGPEAQSATAEPEIDVGLYTPLAILRWCFANAQFTFLCKEMLELRGLCALRTCASRIILQFVRERQKESEM